MTTLIILLILITCISKGCPEQRVWQSGAQTVYRGSSVKLNCTFAVSLYMMRLSLTWVKVDKNKVETRIFPPDGSVDSARFHVDSEAFRIFRDAGIHLTDLRGRDSGLYRCSVSVQHGGASEECRGEGTDLTVRATIYDGLIACCPLGLLIAALLVLHGMTYRQWREYRTVTNARGRKSEATSPGSPSTS